MAPFVCWIEDYPLPNGLKMPSHVGSYDGKRDANNYLLFLDGAICMQKWAMSVACYMFTYTFKDSTRIWWNGQKAGSILNYEDLKATFWSHFSQQKKFTKTHLAVHNIKQKEGEVQELLLLEFLSINLPPTYKGLMEKTYTCIKAREVAINRTLNDHQEGFNRFKKNSSWDNNKGKKNRDRFSSYRGSNHELLSNLSKSPKDILATEKLAKTSNNLLAWHHVEEALKSRQLAHLVKGIKKEKAKVSDTQQGEWMKGDKDTTPVEAHILKISMEDRTSKRRSLRVGWKVPLVGFSRERSWPLDEVPLEIIIGKSPLARTEVLNFVIVRIVFKFCLMPLDLSLNFKNMYVALTAAQLEYGGNAIDLSCMF
nr:hypothetical protein [Tanacetum cinerariifolium]